METPIRSFTLAIGLKNSSLARMFAFTPCICGRRFRRTSGVSPMVSVIESKTRPRPTSRFSEDLRGSSDMAVSGQESGTARLASPQYRVDFRFVLRRLNVEIRGRFRLGDAVFLSGEA